MTFFRLATTSFRQSTATAAFTAKRSFHATTFKMVHQIQNHEEFKTKVQTAGTGRLAVVDFFATWCGPCKVIAPQLEKMSEEFKDVDFYKLDVDENAAVAGELAVRAMPTFMFFKDGQKLDEVIGANIKAVRSAIEKHK
ncbi:thioredoxin TrxA [Pyronema domesticum]|uniref:Similar to Thioredoxin acc. no. P29429 n=1 Tax=Pyronema omphalodes (strain CBS 100304) TaxID=1076935 RepID=U4LBY0_PYROM|nr:thioredoxin TrxA [Pyronema domesticum]CCX16789.1 Similar to Thioredoxin; acc. no. P29429 [Pyronema omphalodes CBS 100304]